MAVSMIWHTEEYMEEYALRWVGSRLIGLEDTQATTTNLPKKTWHLALLHLCRTQRVENRKN